MIYAVYLDAGSTEISSRCLALLPRLQTVVDILPPNTAVTDCAIVFGKLSANEVFGWGSSGWKFVANKSDYIRHFFYN